MSKGILLIATGHANYGHLAHNLAMSLSCNTDLPITLACDAAGGSHLHAVHRLLFDQIIDIPKAMTHTNGLFNGVKAKLYLNDLTPYDETLFIDADTLWCPKKRVEDLFKEVEKTDLAIQNMGYAEMKKKELPKNQNQWVELDEVKKAYKLKSGRYYNYFSEVIYFKKTKDTNLFFKTAQKVWHEWKVPLSKNFGGGIPDEACFAIASCLTKTYPHAINWIPSYWWHYQRNNLSNSEIYNNYYIYSIGGNTQTNNVAKFYNNLAQYYGNQLGWQHFKHKDKRTWSLNRNTI